MICSIFFFFNVYSLLFAEAGIADKQQWCINMYLWLYSYIREPSTNFPLEYKIKNVINKMICKWS